MSWFETKLGKGAGSGKSKLENLENYKATPFWLPYGGSTKISFLDPPDKPFPVRHFHKIPVRYTSPTKRQVRLKLLNCRDSFFVEKLILKSVNAVFAITQKLFQNRNSGNIFQRQLGV